MSDSLTGDHGKGFADGVEDLQHDARLTAGGVGDAVHEHGHVPSHEAVIRDVPSQGHPLVQLGLQGRGFLQGFTVTK